MTKFKVGDRVRFAEKQPYPWYEHWSGVLTVVDEGGMQFYQRDDGVNGVISEKELVLVDDCEIPAIDAHYTKYAIQPMEFSLANNLDVAQHTVIKYTVRYRDKGGIRDLKAAIRVLELMIEREEKANA